MVLAILGVIAFAPMNARSATGMATMQYYVGTWSCTGGTIGQAAQTATLTYTLDNGVMRQWVTVPAQGKMKTPFALNSTTTYDAKDVRFVQAGLDSTAAWWITYAKPWTGNTEVWMDHATSSGKLGRGETIRTNQNAFTFSSYPSASSTKPSFRVTCHRT